MPKLFVLSVVITLAFVSCTSKPSNVPEAPASDIVKLSELSYAKRIIHDAVDAMGVNKLNNAKVSFRFRDKNYLYSRRDGRFVYERSWIDSTSGLEIRDVLDNDTLIRYVAGNPKPLTDKKKKAYANSVNSVIYFAFMPYALLDPAVRPTLEGQDTINGREYDRIRIRFAKEGGGNDYQDEFLYWFDAADRSLDYLSYSHPGGAMPRFRVATNVRTVNGVTVQDYDNFATPDKSALDISRMLDAYKRGNLTLLSEIDLQEVSVSY